MSQTTQDGTAVVWGMETLSESERYRLLSDRHRRTALDVLEGLRTPVDLEDVATAIAEREAESDLADERAVERVKTQLHHVDLPMMDEFGVVSYSPETNRVESRLGSGDA